MKKVRAALLFQVARFERLEKQQRSLAASLATI